jgi:hypothetical protein
MPQINIRTQDLKDKFKPLFPEYTGSNTILLELESFGILEGGMESGKTSVALFLRANDIVFLAETSAEIFRSMAAALEGAEARFLENQNVNNLNLPEDGKDQNG